MPYTFKDFAIDTLAQAKEPLTRQEVWQLGCQLGLQARLRSKGKTPEATLARDLYIDVRDNPSTPFLKVGHWPARFFLKERQAELPSDLLQPAEGESAGGLSPEDGISLVEQEVATRGAVGSLSGPAKAVTKVVGQFKERDLHPYLSDFVANSPLFHGEKTIYTKTIFHEVSKKKGYGEWVHPDMVGVYMPIQSWDAALLAFSREARQNIVTLFSFELKLKLNRSNYRESFFQAVSNSSWANEGYLVAGQIDEDDDLLEELDRLSSAFGIGIIELDRKDVSNSSVRFRAKPKVDLDWATMNKLCSQNWNFQQFIDDVRGQVAGGFISRERFDPTTLPEI
jgi:hypothetical protein